MNKGLLAYPQPRRYTESYNTNYKRALLARYLVTSTNTDYVEFDYTYSGEKIRKRSFGTGEGQRLYLGGVEFLEEEAESYYFSEGRVGLDTLNFQYKLTDHLGNTVVLFEDRDGDGDLLTELDTQDSSLVEVLQRNYYDPFGMPMQGTWQDTTAPRMDYLYNGKELEEELDLDWLAYGARYYDGVIGRFMGVDPHAERYPSWTPYNYVYNNPINGIDPDGRDGILLVWKNYPDGGIPLTGHAGVLLIDNKTGTTKYYEYCRYDKDNYGIVLHYAVPDVVLGDDGRPTAESLNKVVSFIGDKSGTKKGTEYVAQGAYFESDNFKEMNEYAQGRLAENADANRDAYSTWSNNCGDFACQTLKQDESINKKSPLIEAPDPYSLIGQYQGISDYNLNYKPGTGTTINYNEQTVKYNEQTKQTTSSQSWWQKLWYGKQD